MASTVTPLPPPLQLETDEDYGELGTRFSSMVPDHVVAGGQPGENAQKVLEQWRAIFSQFDRDGGGDVDLRELGLMFRHLGQKPSEAQMQLFIEEVDIDGSGTVDFEEFCLLMMREQRRTRCPEWLFEMLHPPLFDEKLPGVLPSIATLNDARHDAAKRIRRHMGRISGEDGNPEAPAKDSLGVRPAEFNSFTREVLLSIMDLLPSAEHVKTAQLSGHGATFGPFIVQELLWRLVTSTRTTLEHLELAGNQLGDDGAVAVARAIMKMSNLVSIDLSANGIGQRGAKAIYEALGQMPQNSRLTVLRLDDNRGIPPMMQAAIATQALSNNLHTVVNEARGQPMGKQHNRPASADLFGAGFHPLEQQVEGMPMPVWPSCALKEEWLGAAHMPALRNYLTHTAPKKPPIRALHLNECPRLNDAAVAHLFSAPPPGTQVPHAPTAAQIEQSGLAPPPIPSYAFLTHLQYLRVSSCACADRAANALADAAEGGFLSSLVGLALDRNELTLADQPRGAVGASPGGRALFTYNLASKFGACLRCLPNLEQLDLCHNEGLSDDACAALIATLLMAPTESGSPGGSPLGARTSSKKAMNPAQAAARVRGLPASVRILHLGATGAGDAAAAAIGRVLPTCRLQALCLGGDVGDKGAMALAASLPSSRTLKELWLGNRIGDVGLPAIVAALSSPGMPIKLLGLGGKVRGGISMTNRLETRAPLLLAEALRAQPEGVNELRLSGNARIGGAGIATLIGALKSCSALRELHVDGCGITNEHSKAIVQGMNEVWCLNVLVVEGSGGGGGSPAKRGWGRRASASVPVLSMQQRLHLARLLEDNRRYGRRRVDSFLLSRSLDEVAWVFNELCAEINEEIVKGPLAKWDGEACAQLARNLALSQYAESFAFNLTGAALPNLQMAQLAQLGVGSHDDQKCIMKAVRDLLHAYERREAVAKAQASWTLVLGGRRGSKTEASEAAAAAGTPNPTATARRAARTGRRSRRGSQQAAEETLDEAAATPTAISQRPDPMVAMTLAEVSKSRGSVAALTARPAFPALGSSLAGRIATPPKSVVAGKSGAQTARTSREAAGRGAAVLPALPGTPGRAAANGLGTVAVGSVDARQLLEAASAVGQLSAHRENAAALPVNAWLARQPRSPWGMTALPTGRHGVLPPVSSSPKQPPAAVPKLSRNEDLSRRILQSLSAGGKLPPTPNAGKRPAFFVDAKNEENRTREAIIKLRLGVSDGV